MYTLDISPPRVNLYESLQIMRDLDVKKAGRSDSTALLLLWSWIGTDERQFVGEQ